VSEKETVEETFRRIAALVDVCPYARMCVTPNFYWYSKNKEYCKTVCSTGEHKNCSPFSGFVAMLSTAMDEDRVVKEIRKHRLYRPCPWIVAIESGLVPAKNTLESAETASQDTLTAELVKRYKKFLTLQATLAKKERQKNRK